MSSSRLLGVRSLALLVAAAGALAVVPALDGRAWSGTVGLGQGPGWSWRLDVAACVLLVYVGVLGWLVARFCSVNLRGRGRRSDVGVLLAVILLCLCLTAASASIVGFAAGWTASGLLVTALISRAGTERAPGAAAVMRRHLLVGDVALWTGIALWASWFPTTDRASLALPPGWHTTLVASLLAVACVARSGLVPSHRWLPETAEAPSPVSALLHAGVVNGAGLLGVAAWPVFAASPVVLAAVLVLGLLTVAVGAWAGAVRRDAKGRLAWSTTTQMGYMSVQLGLGLPAMALMHLIAHGFYKSWSFLRAGGAAERHRNGWGTVRRPAAQAAAAVGALAVLAVAAAPAGTSLLETNGATAVVPLLVAATGVALAGWGAAGLRRASLPVVLGALVIAGAAGAAYVWLLRGWELLLSPEAALQPVWAPVAGTALAALCVLTAAVVVWGRRTLTRSPSGPLALRLLPLSLSPGRRPRGAVTATLLDSTRRAAVPAPTAQQRDRLDAAAGGAAATTGPSWPVGTMVAANPLAALEQLPFGDAVELAERAHGTRVTPGLDYFLARYESGRITDTHLARALEDHADLAAGPAAFVERTRQLAAAATAATARPATPSRTTGTVTPGTTPAAGTGTAYTETDGTTHTGRPPGRLRHLLPERCHRHARLVLEHEGAWTLLAWSDAHGRTDRRQPAPGPYTLWRTAAAHPGYDRVTRIRGAAEWVRALPADPAGAILTLAAVLELEGRDLEDYLRATVADGPGWAGHAMWRCRETGDTAPLHELLALRMAHDVLLCRTGRDADATLPAPAPADGRTPPPARDPGLELAVGLVWQQALELGVQEWLVGAIDHARPWGSVGSGRTRPRPASQSLWCIDVRSERIRRHLEAIGRHETFGFAGFFGADLRFTDPDGNVEDLCPVLLRPGHTGHVGGGSLRLGEAVHRTATSVSRNPVAALAVAEGGGFLAGLTSLASTLRPARTRAALHSGTPQGARTVPGGGQGSLQTDLGVRERADLAHSALLATGLVSDFAPVLLICGHGATVENNAFAAAYDCGACGGHPGVVNAVLLAEVLNDPSVRRELASRGITLPADTVAVAALHDTTTDRVSLLGDLDDPDLVRDLEVAGARAAHERLRSLPPRRRRETARDLRQRASDWSEPTPEWGLAGNAALVIGPRSLTRGAGLDGRVFLHSYDQRVDPDGAVLEQLLTAPLVVAQWINAQYYFSASAPHLYGAGDKTTHNVVGDVGVLTGARGDLRTGLPWQALFRSSPERRGSAPAAAPDLVHEPVRLTVVVAASPGAVTPIIRRHETLRRLVANDWITVLVATPDGRYLVLDRDLHWRQRTLPVSGPASDAPAEAPAEAPLTTPTSSTRTSTTKEPR